MFFDVLNSLMESKKVSRQDLAKVLSIGKNQIKYWETHGNIPNAETLKKIADYFGVSVYYLLGKEEQSTTLTKREQFLLDSFRALNETGKEYILQTIEMAKMTYKKSDTISDMEKIVG